MLKWLIKEPLVHFLLLGLSLFLVFDVLNPNPVEDPTQIAIDRDRLLTFMQYRAKQFDGRKFGEVFDQLSPAQLQVLVDDYVREEALYRQAKALNLDANDYVARQRLIQQFTYLTQGFVDASTRLSDADIENYLNQHRDRYREPDKITFTHVFFSTQRRPMSEALTLAQNTLKTLNLNQIPFHQGLAYGDRFLYHANYVNKEADLVASHVGTAMQTALFELTPSESQWRGPFVSDFGVHLALVTARQNSYDPPLEQVRGRVAQDALQARVKAQTNKAISGIVESYSLKVDAVLQARLPTTDSQVQATTRSLTQVPTVTPAIHSPNTGMTEVTGVTP